jgi:hypothetical protein
VGKDGFHERSEGELDRGAPERRWVLGVGGRPEGSLYHVLATARLSEDRIHVLKHRDTFAVFDHADDIKAGGLWEEGMYHEGTRDLSCLVLELEGRGPFSSTRRSVTRTTSTQAPSPTSTSSAVAAHGLETHQRRGALPVVVTDVDAEADHWPIGSAPGSTPQQP